MRLHLSVPAPLESAFIFLPRPPLPRFKINAIDLGSKLRPVFRPDSIEIIAAR